MEKLFGFFKEEEGATAVEYSIMVALIAVVIIVTVAYLGRNVEVGFNKAGSGINSALQ